jgi:hypothetical protein
VRLPFTFTFFGQLFDKIWANPNGLIQFDPLLPCGRFAPYWFGGDNNLNNSYYNQVAGYVTDLNPADSPDVNIYTHTITATTNANANANGLPKNSSRDRQVITFEDVRYYNLTAITDPAYDNSFRISLFRDSHIEIHYDKLYDGSISSQLPPRNMWFTGLRSPSPLSAPPERIIYTAAQEKAGVNEWGFEVAGIYPGSKAAVASGNMFVACPVSTSWCVYPTRIDIATPFNPSTSYLNLAALSLSCESKLDWGIIINPQNSSGAQTVACDVESGVILCRIADVIAITGPTNRSYSIVPAWRSKEIGGVFEGLPIDSLVIEIYNSTESPSTAADKNTMTNTSGNSANDVCAIDYRLNQANLICNSPIEPVLYSYPSCNGTCASTFGAIGVSFYTDDLGNCCRLSDMDCAGVCYGESTTGQNTGGAIMCCGYANDGVAYRADCVGVCEQFGNPDQVCV